VHREVQATVPVTVEYSLTALGVSFTGIIDEMKVWAEGNVMQMLEAQREYDLANA
jgi:DNA-binding HxlR family transcriptional regulator